MVRQFNIIDLFSGAGGLTEGFFQNSYSFAGHLEKDQYASDTLKTRMLFHRLKTRDKEIYYDYLQQKITREDLFSFFSDNYENDTLLLRDEITSQNESDIINIIKQAKNESGNPDTDLIIGGPPCQAYSTIGRGRLPGKMPEDPRNFLFRHYLKFLETFNPRMFVFENVPGIRSARKGEVFSTITRSFHELGYTTSFHILNAKDFGVLQERKRLIIIGSLNDIDIGDIRPKKNPYPDSCIWDIFRDLPKIQAGVDAFQYGLTYSPEYSEYLKKTGIRTINDVLTHHIARPHIERDLNIYKLAVEKWDAKRERIMYDELPEDLRTHKNLTSFLDRFKVVDGNRNSHAIVSHLSKDGHYFIHPDINQNRSITVREAARIQSFPDNYFFEGPRTSQFVQIGNAVPPLMAKGIAAVMLKYLRKI